MAQTECEQLEDYLCGELADTQSIQFERHCDECQPCRDAVEQQRQIDRLLVDCVNGLEPLPTGLRATVQSRAEEIRRRRFIVAIALLTTAASLAFVIVSFSGRSDTSDLPNRKEVVSTQPTPIDPRTLVQVTVNADTPLIPVPIATENPQVSIIWFYETIEPTPLAAEPTDDVFENDIPPSDTPEDSFPGFNERIDT